MTDKNKSTLADSFKAFFVDTLDDEEKKMSEERGQITRKPATPEDLESNFKSSPPAFGDAIADADGREQ